MYQMAQEQHVKTRLHLYQGLVEKGITVSSSHFPGSRHGIILILAVNA